MALLEVNDISVSYGGIQALQGVSLHVDKGEVVTIIGANGAGKSSLLNAISSMVPYHEGEITYEGKRLPGQPYNVVGKGIIQVPEGRQVFANLNVEDNLRIGAYLRRDKAGIEEDLEQGAASGGRDLPHRQRYQRGGHHTSPCRAEREESSVGGRPGVRAGDRQDYPGGKRTGVAD